MEFDTFKSVITEMYTKDSREIPNNSLIKTAFDYIDIRKDGVLDRKEWMKTFGVVDVMYYYNF